MTLYLVSDQRWLQGRSLKEDIQQALEGGITCLQIREKSLNKETFLKEILDIKALTDQFHVPLIVNDDIHIMLEADADGVHVGQNDMEASKVRKIIGKDKILGVSARTVKQALKAQEAGADYLGVGAVFPTSTKDDAREVDLKTLQEICQAVSIPVVAIGGINENNIQELQGIDIDGVAVVSAILSKQDIQQASQILLNKVKQL